MMFKIGQRYVSQAEPTLGLGIVSEVQGRTVKILFPSIGQARIYRTDEAPIERFVLQVGETVKKRVSPLWWTPFAKMRVLWFMSGVMAKR